MGQFKIRAKINTSKLKRIIDKKQKLIQENIKTVLKREAFPVLISMIMDGYDDLSQRAEMEPDDPTNPSNWRVEFLTKLEQDVERTFIVTGNRISVKLGDKNFLGYDASGKVDPNDTEPLHWMVFFIEGLIGDWAFITPDIYTRLTGGAAYDVTWGRFAEGFMVSKQSYEEKGWDRVIPFTEVRHPFSGFSPLDIFTEALREFNLRPFIQRAVEAATEGRKI